MTYKKIAFLAAPAAEAAEARDRLVARYGGVDAEDADVIVALGGDGMMLHTIHERMTQDVPIYFINATPYHTAYKKELMNAPMGIWGTMHPMDRVHWSK